MSSSALIGHLPNNDDDYAIIRGFARLLGIPDEKLDPAKGFPLMVKPPAGHPSYASQGPGINASMGVAIALVTIITGTRLFLRGFRRDLSFSYDDCVIIPALIGAIAWWGLAIGIAVKGGAGKHLYDVTYIESHWFSRVRYQTHQVILREIETKFLVTSTVAISIHCPLLGHGSLRKDLHHPFQPPTHMPDLSTLEDNA